MGVISLGGQNPTSPQRKQGRILPLLALRAGKQTGAADEVSSDMRRTLNVKFAAGLIILVVVFGTAVHFLHSYQVKRNAGAILDQARRARDEGRDDQAAVYLGDYLRYMPKDKDALA